MADSSDTIFSLLLTFQGQSSRKVLKLTSSSTLDALHRAASETLGMDASSFTISVGFPPRQLSINSSMTLVQAGVHNQDRLLANLVTSADFARAKEKPARGKRKAAQTATESFVEIMRAQDEIMVQEASKSSRKPSAPGSSRSRTPRFSTALAGAGRRLADGTLVSPSKRGKKLKSSQGDDPSLALLGTLQDKRQAGQLMRRGWRNAVTNAYEQNQAVARLAAIPQTVKIECRDDVLAVEYPKSVQGRGVYHDEVDFLPLDVLKSCLEGIHASNLEGLRPENLAVLSPRVLWSLVHHHPDRELGEIYRTLLPDLDWSFLRRRSQQLSEKARENLRQEQQAAGATDNLEAAAAAIASVEAAMEDLSGYNRSLKRQYILSAIDNRQHFVLQTPMEEDDDELRECMGGALVDNVDDVIQSLMTHQVRNWRQLANCYPEEVSSWLNLPLETTTPWIERAQLESVEEIIVEVCEGDTDAVVILHDHASSGTPKDLSNWAGICDLLREELVSGTGSDDVPSVEQLQRWCDRAQQAMEQLPWLSAVATPVQ